MNTLLALSIAIAAGLAVSRLARLVRLPNVTAVLVGGLLIGPAVLGILPRAMLDGFSVVTEAALGFIAYSIGAEFKMSYLKRIGAKPLTITAFEGLGAVILVDVVLIGCSLAGVPGIDLPMCVALGAIAAATAPAATLMVIRQYKARGPVSEMLLPVVAMDDALGLIAFAFGTAVESRAVDDVRDFFKGAFEFLPVHQAGVEYYRSFACVVVKLESQVIIPPGFDLEEYSTRGQRMVSPVSSN